MTAQAWTIDGTHARLALGHFRACLDVEHADQGLSDLVVDDTTLPLSTMLGLDAANVTRGTLATAPVDLYVRQNDLVATYGEQQGERRRLQAYWRAIEPEQSHAALAIIELVVSVQTELLDSTPAMCVCSRFPAAESIYETDEGQAFVLVRPVNQCLSLMQAAHPSDCTGIEHSPASSRGSQVDVRHRLFAENLEKGVIRRARIRVAVFPRAGDLEVAAACFRQFAASEPMLTA